MIARMWWLTCFRACCPMKSQGEEETAVQPTSKFEATAAPVTTLVTVAKSLLVETVELFTPVTTSEIAVPARSVPVMVKVLAEMLEPENTETARGGESVATPPETPTPFNTAATAPAVVCAWAMPSRSSVIGEAVRSSTRMRGSPARQGFLVPGALHRESAAYTSSVEPNCFTPYEPIFELTSAILMSTWQVFVPLRA